MRILAIRGNNLASLSRPFELDLNAPPLGSSGLFVITGPTGAGKSSILDALCLALFDRMPRLPGGSGVAVGRADEGEQLRVRSNDVRSILSRGAGSGFAEVDFQGVDGHRYRARWEVRRAYNRPGGRLQQQDVTLTDLAANQRLGHGKQETLQLISRRLGLTFEQFRRSVLLAQGDFAAFLKAKGDERSSLLERITGSEIYSELSIAAHRRASDEQLQLQQLEQRLQENPPLEASAREELQHQLQQLDAEIQDLKQQLEALQRQVQWYSHHASLQQAWQQANASHREALQAWEEASGRRDLLQRVERVQPLRSLLDAANRCQLEVTDARQNLQESQRRLQSAIDKEAATQREVTQAAAALQQAEKALEAARPLLARGRQLDSAMDSAQQRITLMASELAQLEQAAREIADQIRRREETRAESLRLQQEADDWLQRQAFLAPVAQQWARWQALLQQLLALQREASLLQEREKAVAERLTRGQQRLQQYQRQQDRLTEQLQDLQQEMGRLEAAVAACPLDELSVRRSELTAQHETLRVAHDCWQQADQVRQQLAGERADALRAGQARDQARERLQILTRERGELEAALDEARRALDLALLTQSEHAEHLRAALQAGEHCPVCGATEHPWASADGLLTRQLAQQRQRVAELERERTRIVAESSVQEEREQQALARIEQAERRIELAEQSLQRLQRTWVAGMPPGFTADGLNAATTGQQLVQAMALSQTSLEQVLEKERSAHRLRKRLDEMRGDWSTLQQEEKQLAAGQAALTLELQEWGAEQVGATQRMAAIRDEQAGIHLQLDEALHGVSGWRRRMEQDGAGFLQWLAGQLAQWDERQAALQRVTESLAGDERELAIQQRVLQERQQAVEAQQRHLRSEREQLAGLEAERSEIFAGQGMDVVETRLNDTLASARVALEEAQRHLSGAAGERAEAAQMEQHWSRQRQQCAERLELANTHLEQALRSQGLTREALQRLLRHDAGWLQQEKASLDELKITLERHASTLQARATDLAQQEKMQPAETLEQLQIQQDEARSLLDERLTLRAECQAALREDTARRARAQELQQAFTEQRERWHSWAGLDSLIGSHDGRKFRTFAQGLTLDTLLAQANHHLQELAPRYLLQRVPGSDLELQVVDRDMGDEVRSVHSLSGGESFLLSLALALGLASISGGSTRVESLFIDEGFGSLDQETLDITISSLDTLQSLGRQVGIISHLSALVERVGVRVEVQKLGEGRSRVQVMGVAG